MNSVVNKMREIKFRAYDDTDVLEDVVVLDNKTILIFNNGVLKKYKVKAVVQYITLKDKNGVEIYDSDIVEVDTTGINYQPEIIKGVVKFIDGCFTVEFEKPVYDVVLKYNRARLYVKCFSGNKAIKVIGNIYEQETHT